MEGSLDLEIKNGASSLPGEQPPEAASSNRVRKGACAPNGAQALAVRLVFAIASLGAPFLIWYLGTRYRVQFYIRFQDVPTPLDVFHAAVHVAASSAFSTNIGNSLRRIFLGFFIALLSGVGLGLVIGRYRIVKQLLIPAIEVLRPIPAIAWVPLSIMLWPTTESSIVFITFIGAFYPILLNTVDGVESLDGVLLRAGRCLGASEAQLFWHVILPGVLPNIFTGLAVGMGVAWVSLIAAEMIAGQYGVGYYTWEAYSLVNYPAIVLGMITIGSLGLICSGAIRLVGQFSMPWLASVNGARK
ncbi:ABC transporter permease subunit [Paraburkholderia sp. NMBU_R16]|uniref:ABC transporter permease n=1 Tax=Paraburkholderia sp. NMBU_R16 TaxID=2698676 RepID=UPI001566661F|nr:ABC transporter permease [Paraburkholderia sp. NMBU_R16]NRO95552.1 ABC transporter permease subunit [Paraburkholderia sp. NMBU_R16]